MVFFGVLGVGPRGGIEEGGTIVCFWGNFCVMGLDLRLVGGLPCVIGVT
jgi:hypothetical protein